MSKLLSPTVIATFIAVLHFAGLPDAYAWEPRADERLGTDFSAIVGIKLEPKSGPNLERNLWNNTVRLHAVQQDNEVDNLLQVAIGFYREKRFDEALANCTKASKVDPNDHRPHVLTAYVHMAQMKMKSASEALATAIRLRPEAKELYLLKASIDSRRNAHEEALATSRKAVEIDPNYAEAYAMIGEILQWDEKRRAEAISALEMAIKINPRVLPAYEHLGQILERTKDDKRAEEVFRQGLATDPQRMNCRFALGRLLVKHGRLVEARELWAGRTSDRDDTFPRFIELLERAENLKRATEALGQNPNDPDKLIDMGLAVMEGDSWVIDDRQKRAIVYFRKALEIKPNYPRAQYAICKAYIQFAEDKTIDRELAKLRKIDPVLAREMEEYRKKYVGGIISTGTVNVNQ